MLQFRARNPEAGTSYAATTIEALLLSSRVEIPTYCETLRHQGRRRSATTFHAVVNVPGEADRVWVACGECTRLMLDGVDATVA